MRLTIRSNHLQTRLCRSNPLGDDGIKMRFATLFLKTQNVHLTKDVGMLPYLLHKLHATDSVVVTYKNDEEYGYIDDEVKGLKLEFVEKTGGGIIFDGVRYLAMNAPKIDVLNTYHLNLSSYIYGIVYKRFNPKGRIYLKLDMNPKGLITCFKKNPVGMIKRSTIKRADIVSVETVKMYEKLKQVYGDKILYIPNGCYSAGTEGDVPDKKDVILTVGNLGTYEKATDVLLEAFAKFTEDPKADSWQLRLVGTVDDAFKGYVEEYYKRYPKLKERVTFTGPIYDRPKLDEEYSNAKIFTLPSLSESFGIVLVEAAMNGCYLITSDMVPAGYDISDKHKNGTCVKAGDSDELAAAFLKMTDESINWEEIAKNTAAFVKTAFDWNKIANRLYKALR